MTKLLNNSKSYSTKNGTENIYPEWMVLEAFDNAGEGHRGRTTCPYGSDKSLFLKVLRAKYDRFFNKKS